MSKLQNTIKENFAGQKYDFEVMEKNLETWEQVLAITDYVPVAYRPEIIAYQKTYFEKLNSEIIDISPIIYQNKKTLGIWPLSVSIKDGKYQLSSQGSPVLPPLLIKSLPPVTIKNIYKTCCFLAQSLSKKLNISNWESLDPFLATPLTSLSDWHILLLKEGGIPSLKHTLYTDLSIGISEYKRTLRKSYKSLVLPNPDICKVSILTTGNYEIWEEFRKLHLSVSGKVTRSKETWDHQFDALSNGQSFLVYLRDKSNVMIGAGYFTLSAQEASYSVGVYNRSLFSQPLGHVVQFAAVEKMMNLGLKWYRLGEYHLPSDITGSSEKEMSISKFKSGFSTHIMPEYLLKMSVSFE